MNRNTNINIDTDVLIIGAGVIGLSISYHFLKNGFKVILIDNEKNFGTVNSSRNTETIHAGIYYKENSLKHLLCVRGKELIYNFCEKYNIKYKKCGKIFIANNYEEELSLNKIKDQGKKNGITDLIELDKKQILNIEPMLNAQAGLMSPSSGIIDSYDFMQKLMNISSDLGLIYSNYSEIKNVRPIEDHWIANIYNIKTLEEQEISTKSIINSAGLNSINLSKMLFPDVATPELNPVKGVYLKYSGKSPFKHIIYPSFVPGKIGERVDATPNVHGELRFGPSVEKSESINDFSVNEKIISKFLKNIKKYFPLVEEKKLYLDQAGIRPKIIENNINVSDFKFVWVPSKNWLNLWGIESPGLTSSLAIGEYVYEKFKKEGII